MDEKYLEEYEKIMEEDKNKKEINIKGIIREALRDLEWIKDDLEMMLSNEECDIQGECLKELKEDFEFLKGDLESLEEVDKNE